MPNKGKCSIEHVINKPSWKDYRGPFSEELSNAFLPAVTASGTRAVIDSVIF